MFKSILKMRAGLILRLSVVLAFPVLATVSEAHSHENSVYTKCPAFPGYTFMTKHDHKRMTAYVDAEFFGDWEPVMERLTWQLDILKTRFSERKGVRLRLDNRTRDLAGDELARYIQASIKRLQVVSCLAGRQTPSAFDAFETAAGDETMSHLQPAVPDDLLQVSVKALCDEGETLLKIKNTGPAWPKKAVFDIVRISRNGVSLEVSRRLRMKEDQMVTFRVPRSATHSASVGLFVRPSWYQRLFKFDAEVACG